MDVSEIPMILFTVIAQMCVGAFIVLGAIQVLGAAKHSSKVIDRLADPALLAIGPSLVLGLLVSMLHMHDITNTLNVVRHIGTSWLSREIVFGMLFAGAGFLFALIQWRKFGPPILRTGLAVVTALFGIALVWSMANIYASLPTVPVWNSWFTIVQFFATSILLGSMAIGVAIVGVTALRQRRLARHGEPDADAAGDGGFLGAANLSLTPADARTRAQVHELLGPSVRGIVVAALASALTIFVALPIFLGQIAQTSGPTTAHALAVYGGTTLGLRLGLLALGIALLVLFAYLMTSDLANARPLAFVMGLAFVLVIVAEFIGRGMFYESMMRVGV